MKIAKINCSDPIGFIDLQSGMALIIVLWMLVVMSAMALSFSQTVRTEVMLTANYQTQAKATGLAEAGIWRGAAMVLNRTIAANHGNDISLAGSVYTLKSDMGVLKVSLQSCSGLIDLNQAPPEVIKSLLQAVGAPTDMTDLIVDSWLDWRDEDDLKRLNGAERDDYLAQGLNYGPNNGVMNSVSELARVNGISPAVYEALKPLVTVYSGQPRVDIKTAPERVLAALPAMNNGALGAVLGNRKQIDLAVIPADTRKYIGAGQNEFIKISSFAKVKNSVSGIIAIVKLEPTQRTPVTVMSWRQNIEPRFMDERLGNE